MGYIRDRRNRGFTKMNIKEETYKYIMDYKNKKELQK